jgi:hypothetical protein
MNDLREEVEEALVKIPGLLSCTNRNLNAIGNSPELHERSASVFVAVIALLQQIMNYYEESSTSEFLLLKIPMQGG